MRVLLQGHLAEEPRWTKLLKQLGAELVTEVNLDSHFDVFVATEIKRNIKLLHAINIRAQIVGSTWLQACAKTHSLVADYD